MFPKDYEKICKKLGFLVNLRSYSQFHIHSVKSFLHIKMIKKSNELEMKLSNAKIISDDIMRNSSSMAYMSSGQRKQEELKLLSDEFTKVQLND